MSMKGQLWLLKNGSSMNAILKVVRQSTMTANERFWYIGVVPVVVVLTKADAMKLAAIGELRNQGLTIREAISRAGELATQKLNRLKAGIENQLSQFKYPPKDCLTLACKYLQCIVGPCWHYLSVEVWMKKVQTVMHFWAAQTMCSMILNWKISWYQHNKLTSFLTLNLLSGKRYQDYLGILFLDEPTLGI